MSREIIYRCDKCGEVITGNRYLLQIMKQNTPFLEEGEPYERDLCETHKDELLKWIDHEPAGIGVVSVDCIELNPQVIAEGVSESIPKELEKSKRGRPKKIDEGKIMALSDAGWDIPKIADEMKLTEAQVRHAMQYAKKKAEEKQS